jgi:hypothetical protein
MNIETVGIFCYALIPSAGIVIAIIYWYKEIHKKSNNE